MNPAKTWLQRVAGVLLRRPLLTAALVGAVPAASVQSAELFYLEDECNGRQLVLKGVIEPGDYQRFADHLAALVTGELPEVQDPDVLWTVKLDSPGGDLEEAMRMGRLLRRAFATTDVGYRYARRPDGVYDFERSGELVCLTGDDRLSGCHLNIVEATCAGACLLVWLGGTERHANEGRLGLHGLAGPAGSVGDLEDYLREMGVEDTWVSRMLQANPRGDGWLTWPERRALAGRAGVLQHLVKSCPMPLDPDESYLSVTAEDPLLRDRLMDRAESHRACRRSNLAEARAGLVEWLRERNGASGDALAAAGGLR